MERGFLLETWKLDEMRAVTEFPSLAGELRHWRTPSGSEVDFVWTRAKRAIGIEVKASGHWRHGFGEPLKSLIAGRMVQSGLWGLHWRGGIKRWRIACAAVEKIPEGSCC